MGSRERRHRIAFAVSLLIPPGLLAGCTYEYTEPGHPPTRGTGPMNRPTSEPAGEAASAPVYVDPLVLEREVKNYGELDRLLKAVPGPAIFLRRDHWMARSRALEQRRRCRPPGSALSPLPVLVLPAPRCPLGRSIRVHPSGRLSSRWIVMEPLRRSLRLSRGTFLRIWSLPDPVILRGRGQLAGSA